MGSVVPNIAGGFNNVLGLTNRTAGAVGRASRQLVGPDQGLTDVQKEQQRQYETYKSNLPRMQNQLQEQLTRQANIDIAQGQKRSQEQSSARGLGYGGLSEGMKQQVASQGQQQLASQLSNANRGLLDLGNEIQQGGIQTGVGIQGLLQQRQNQLYQQQLANQAANNQTMGSMIGTAANVGLLAAL